MTITVSLDTAGYARRTVSATSYPALPHSHVHRSLANKCHVKRHFFTDFSPIYPTFDRISRVSVASTQMTRQWDACDLSGLNQAESEERLNSSIRQELVKTTRKIFETGMKKAASPKNDETAICVIWDYLILYFWGYSISYFFNSPYSHSLKLALYGVNLGLFARFFGGFDRLFPLRLWSLRKNGIKMVSMIPPGKHGFPTVSIIP